MRNQIFEDKADNPEDPLNTWYKASLCRPFCSLLIRRSTVESPADKGFPLWIRSPRQRHRMAVTNDDKNSPIGV